MADESTEAARGVRHRGVPDAPPSNQRPKRYESPDGVYFDPETGRMVQVKDGRGHPTTMVENPNGWGPSFVPTPAPRKRPRPYFQPRRRRKIIRDIKKALRGKESDENLEEIAAPLQKYTQDWAKHLASQTEKGKPLRRRDVKRLLNDTGTANRLGGDPDTVVDSLRRAAERDVENRRRRRGRKRGSKTLAAENRAVQLAQSVGSDLQPE